MRKISKNLKRENKQIETGNRGNIKAVSYARVSIDKQIDNTSIENQTNAIEKYCKEHDINLVGTYIDEAKSGEHFKDREGFKEMFHRVLSEDIDYIVVFKQDRISRNTLHSQYILQLLKEHDKHLISIADNLNTSDENANLIFQINSLVAEVERLNIITRTNSGNKATFENGDFNGGKIFGYDCVQKKLQINLEEAKVVRYIFDMYTNNNWGYRKIANNLNLQNVKTKTGKAWSINAVKTVLQNRFYIGEVKWQGNYNKGNHDPIIEADLWNNTQKVLEVRGYIQEKIHPGSYPLSGILKCPECNGAMVQGNSSQKYKYYVCNRFKSSGTKGCNSNLVNKEYAEDYVLTQTLNYFNSFNLSTYLCNITKRSLSYEIRPLELRASTIERELRAISKNKQKALDLYDDSIISKNTLKERIERLQEDEKSNNINLKKIKEQIEVKSNPLLFDIVDFAANNLALFIDILNNTDKKGFFHNVINDIFVSKGNTPKDRKIREIVYRNNKSIFSESLLI